MPTLESPTSSHSCHDDWHGSGSPMAFPVSSQHVRDMTLNELSTTKMYRMELKTYLASLLEKEASHGAPMKRITSRQKLSKLNNGQFLELARDAYDEMIRRTKHGNEDPFLPVHDEFHPRRNQARQKLATLAKPRFMDLSSDVYHELSRRYPHTKMEKNDALPPLPCPDDRMTQPGSNTRNEWFPQTVVPERGVVQIDHGDTMSLVPPSSPQQRQGEQEYHAYTVHPLEMDQQEYDRQPNLDSSHTSSNWTDSLDSLIADIDSMVKPGGLSNNARGSNATDRSYPRNVSSRQNSKHSISDYQQHEQQIAELQQRIYELEQLTFDQKTDTDIIERCNLLEQENQQLIHQQRQQEEMIQKVKKETFELLNQLDTLSSKNGEIMADRDTAYQLVDKLQDEVREWQSKHDLVQRQLDRYEFSSLPSPSSETETGTHKQSELTLGIHNLLQTSTNGIISQSSVIAFQSHIEELAGKSRTNQRTDILPCIKLIVQECKSIADQVDQNEAIWTSSKRRPSSTSNSTTIHDESENESNDGDIISDIKTTQQSNMDKRENRARLKTIRRQYALALHHLLAASKGYVHGSGLYSLSLLDASAGHLTNIVIELIELLGVSN